MESFFTWREVIPKTCGTFTVAWTSTIARAFTATEESASDSRHGPTRIDTSPPRGRGRASAAAAPVAALERLLDADGPDLLEVRDALDDLHDPVLQQRGHAV